MTAPRRDYTSALRAEVARYRAERGALKCEADQLHALYAPLARRAAVLEAAAKSLETAIAHLDEMERDEEVDQTGQTDEEVDRDQ